MLLIGTVIYASSGNCVRQLRKGVTLDFPLCIYIYVFSYIIPVTIFFLICHQHNCQGHVLRQCVGAFGDSGLGGSYLQGMLHQDTAWPLCPLYLCQVLPAGDHDFPASVNASPLKVAPEVTGRKTVISYFSRPLWVASKESGR